MGVRSDLVVKLEAGMTLCSDWIVGSDVALCCDVEGDASDPSIYDDAAQQAQELLFEISGRRFNGICEQTVRPCRTQCACGWQVLSRGYVVWNPNWYGYGGWGSWMCDESPCGCGPLSKVPLSGYVQEVLEVKIDGVVIDPATYRVDRHRWLVRQRLDANDETTPVWPGCQALDLPLDEPGTWSVTYTYGVDVPLSGQAAAAELACEIYKACAGGECRLPSGVQRVSRQGVVIEKVPFTVWGWTTGKRAGQVKGWNTGLAMVDAFLNAYNPGGLPRVPTIWSPTTPLRFPVPVTLVGT
jgi:hypothetical protein